MIALLLLVSFAQDPFEKSDAEAAKTMDKLKLSMMVSDTSIEGVVAFLKDFGCPAMHIDAFGAPKAAEQTISLETKKSAIGIVLRDALTVHDLDWVLLDGVVVITSKKGREAIQASAPSDDLRKNKDLWAKLRGKARLDADTTLEEALKALGELSGATWKLDALPKELLAEKLAGGSPELSVLGCLRLVAWEKGLNVEFKTGTVTVTKKK